MHAVEFHTGNEIESYRFPFFLGTVVRLTTPTSKPMTMPGRTMMHFTGTAPLRAARSAVSAALGGRLVERQTRKKGLPTRRLVKTDWGGQTS